MSRSSLSHQWTLLVSQPDRATRKSFESAGDGYYRDVSNLPFPPQPSGPPPWPPPSATPRRPRQLPVIASLAIALIALGVAIGSWFHPASESKPSPAPSPASFTEKQVADAKAKVGATYDKVHQGVLANTGRSGGSDPLALLGVAANARIALYDGGQYLIKTLAEQPATPSDLATAVRQLVDSYQLLAVNYMAEASQSEIDQPSTLETRLTSLYKISANSYPLCSALIRLPSICREIVG